VWLKKCGPWFLTRLFWWWMILPRTTPSRKHGGAARPSCLCRITWLGGCVQAGYRLAFELDFDYVIRVDGDGQHDPSDIPAILTALQHEVAKW